MTADKQPSAERGPPHPKLGQRLILAGFLASPFRLVYNLLRMMFLSVAWLFALPYYMWRGSTTTADLELGQQVLCRSSSIDDLLQVADGGHHYPDEIVLSSSYGVSQQLVTRGRSFDETIGAEVRANHEDISASGVAEAQPDIPEVSGRLHSVESMSAVDGPGLRYLVFLQGCPRKCVFCSNPDSWDFGGGTPTTSKQIAKKIKACSPYLRPNSGGLTISGGEPLGQPELVAALFREVHALGLTTCIDTTGYGSSKEWDIVLPHTDLVLLCLKSFNPDKYYELTETTHRSGFAFAEELEKRGIKFWLRYVMMTGRTDGQDELDPMEEFILSHKACVGLEVLPFHKLGVEKWANLGMDFPLEGMKSPAKEDVRKVVTRFEMLGIKVLCQY